VTGYCPECGNTACVCAELRSKVFAIQSRLLKRVTRKPYNDEWDTLKYHSSYKTREEASKVVSKWEEDSPDRDLRRNHNEYRIVPLK